MRSVAMKFTEEEELFWEMPAESQRGMSNLLGLPLEKYINMVYPVKD